MKHAWELFKVAASVIAGISGAISLVAGIAWGTTGHYAHGAFLVALGLASIYIADQLLAGK
jgi:hypothetical protein